MIHRLTHSDKPSSPRPLISLNCSTLPAEMFEAELFGAEKGAYTGAHQQRNGFVEAAQGGTLFLDEIAEVPVQLQAKLLQFLESREYRRLGSTETRLFNGRIVAATNRNMHEEVDAGRFRTDLWYRLDVFSIHIPPLRERREEVPALAELLLDLLARKYGRRKPLLKPADADLLHNHSYPGNVRELRNILERSLVQTPTGSSWLELDRIWARKIRQAAQPAPPPGPQAAPGPPLPAPQPRLNSLETQEYELIQRTLHEENGAIRRAAARLGLSHQSLLRRLEKWPELRTPRS